MQVCLKVVQSFVGRNVIDYDLNLILSPLYTEALENFRFAAYLFLQLLALPTHVTFPHS